MVWRLRWAHQYAIAPHKEKRSRTSEDEDRLQLLDIEFGPRKSDTGLPILLLTMHSLNEELVVTKAWSLSKCTVILSKSDTYMRPLLEKKTKCID